MINEIVGELLIDFGSTTNADDAENTPSELLKEAVGTLSKSPPTVNDG